MERPARNPRLQLLESKTAPGRELRETATLADATTSTDTGAGRMRIQILTPGWGSSGYYSREVVEAAAPLVQPGTQMYLDHPSRSAREDRPERSVRDIAAIITEAGVWDDELGAIVAEAQPLAPYRDLLTDETFAAAIGLSISGSATDIVVGEAEGRRGNIVEGLERIDSVDFVTHAGRGGRILELFESARPGEATERAIARGVAEATADERRIQLADAVRRTHGGERVHAWVRDFDETTVWFETYADDDTSATWAQSYTVADDDNSTTLDGQRTEVRAVTRYVPVNPSGQATTTQENTMPQIEEARLRELEAAEGRVAALESERDQETARARAAERALAEADARTAAVARARTRVTEANANLAPAVVDRIVATATATIPLTEAAQLDETRLDAAVESARTAEESYLAQLAEAAGTGTVTGFGFGTTPPSEQTVSESDVDSALAGAFGYTVNGA